MCLNTALILFKCVPLKYRRRFTNTTIKYKYCAINFNKKIKSNMLSVLNFVMAITMNYTHAFSYLHLNMKFLTVADPRSDVNRELEKLGGNLYTFMNYIISSEMSFNKRFFDIENTLYFLLQYY